MSLITQIKEKKTDKAADNRPFLLLDLSPNSTYSTNLKTQDSDCTQQCQGETTPTQLRAFIVFFIFSK